MDIELDKFYLTSMIDAIFLQEPFIQVGLPTEIVITKTEIQVPNYGRVYAIDRYLYKGKAYHYSDLSKAVREDTGDPMAYQGTKDYPEILMAEVWRDNPDVIGHLDLNLAGFRFVTRKDWEDPNKNFEDPNGLPYFMAYRF